MLFATDVASRGLDFPSVHWVVQMDCPEDVDTYIHRSGRTARYERGGEALLILTVHEEKGEYAEEYLSLYADQSYFSCLVFTTFYWFSIFMRSYHSH